MMDHRGGVDGVDGVDGLGGGGMRMAFSFVSYLLVR